MIMFESLKRKPSEIVKSPEIVKIKPLKIQTKLNYVDFEHFYLSHPGANAPEMADRFQVSLRTIYNKLKKFNKKFERKVDHKLSSMTLMAFKDGYRQGMAANASKEGYDRLLKAESKASLLTGILIGTGAGLFLSDILGKRAITTDDLFTKFKEMGITLEDLKAKGIDVNSLIEMINAQA